MQNLPSRSTKDIMLMLGKSLLGKNIATDDQDRIPVKYIAIFAKQDGLYAKAREAAKNPSDLIKTIATASALKNHISQNAKAKIEYKLYLEQLETGLKKADEQLAKQRELAKKLDSSLPQWHVLNQEITEKAIRPGVGIDSPTMGKLTKEAKELVDNLINQFKDTIHQSDIIEKSLRKAIEAAEMVVPAEFVKAVSTQTASMNEKEPYIPLPGEGKP